MNREFLEYFERELRILYERAADFAAEHQGLAERLGGLAQERMDPGIKGLIEGAAFMAARVQLKIKSEFSEFTTTLLDQLLPTYLMPVPSSVLVQATPLYEDPNLLEGVKYAPGSRIDAVYIERERRVACRYSLGSELAMYPLRLEKAEYFTGAAPMQALGLEVQRGTASGMRLHFHNRTSPPERDVEGVLPPGEPLKKLMLDSLPIQLLGGLSDCNLIYERLFAHCKRLTLRYEDARGDPVFVPMNVDQIQQIGFGERDRLYPRDARFFTGFDIIRDFFTFPNKFLGFRLERLRTIFSRLETTNFDLLFEFDDSYAALASIINAKMFGLYMAPAINLFEIDCSRIPMDPGEYEHQVVADRSRWLDYEPHRIVSVFAHFAGQRDKIPVYPLYSLPGSGTKFQDAYYFTARQLPRQPTERERRFGVRTNYAGTETYLQVYEPAGLTDAQRVKELSVRALCSNRHLTEQLPVGDTGADFRLADDTEVTLKCVAGPTPPRDSLIHIERKRADSTRPGPLLWRLINLLSLNHLGLADRSEEDRAGGLRELLSLFVDAHPFFGDEQVRGLESVSTRPIVRRLRQANGFNAARGMEITLTFDENAYDGSGVMIVGAALERFLAEYTSINSFTQTVIATSQRGIVMRWPARSGLGGVL